MKLRKTILTLCLTSVLLLTACIGNGSSRTDNTAPVTTSATEAPEPEEFTPVMPVLSIETENQSADVMKFVTEPVAPHVSAQIATWTPHYVMPPEPYYEACHVSLSDKDGSTLLSAGAQVKVRGNWTTTYDKKPLRIKFEEKQNLLGLNDGAQMRDWLLLAEYKDTSMLRDKTALQLARELYGDSGLYAADSELVEVRINGQYWGVYLLTEQQEVSSKRVSITKTEPDYTGTDTGYFLEFDGYFYNEEPLQQFHVDYADNAPLTPYDGNGGSGKTITCLPEKKRDPKSDIGFTIKSKINSQEQHDFIASFVNNVYRIMYAAAYEDKAYQFSADYGSIAEAPDLTPQQAVEQVVDIRSLADAYIIAELTCDADIYWSSFYMDADFGADGSRKLTFEAPWDFDSSMGNKDRCANGRGLYAANMVPDVNGNSYMTVNPWLAVLMYEEWYQDVIRSEWTKLYDSGAFTRAAEMIASDSAQYEAAFDRNQQKWGLNTENDSVAAELSAVCRVLRSEKEGADHLAEWLGTRAAYLNEHWHS